MSKPKKRRRSRAKPGALPKGAYRLPTGGYHTQSKIIVVGSGRNQRRISIHAVHRDPIDIEQLAKALLTIAREQTDVERKLREED
mgnify:CR=1 FL=1